MAAALDDYEHIAITDVGGTDEAGYWLRVPDERSGLANEIDSHHDYWDFLPTFVWGVPAAGSDGGKERRPFDFQPTRAQRSVSENDRSRLPKEVA